MIEGLLTRATLGIGSGGEIGNFLYKLESMGVFAYLLPFLLIFVIIYGIMVKIKIFDKVPSSNMINLIISVAVALMALQFNFVGYFFGEIFPRLGVALSIIIVGVILFGLFGLKFSDEDGKVSPGAKVIGVLVGIMFAIILYQSFDGFGLGFGSGSFGWSWWWYVEQHISMILIIALVLVIIGAVVKGGGNRNEGKKNRREN